MIDKNNNNESNLEREDAGSHIKSCVYQSKRIYPTHPLG